MRLVLSAFPLTAAVVLAVTSCTGETDYDVLDDYPVTETHPTVAAPRPVDGGTDSATPPTSRGVDASTVAHTPDTSSPASDEPVRDASAPPPKKKKGKGHESD